MTIKSKKKQVKPFWVIKHEIKMAIKRPLWRLRAKFLIWRLPKYLNKYLEVWQSIDHRKDRSVSGKDFRFWLYNRMCNGDKIYD